MDELRRRSELAAYCETAIAKRREQPGEDYLSELVADQVARDGAIDMPYLLTSRTCERAVSTWALCEAGRHHV